MMCISSRRGSALLIVLGMLAFMVASAIAFSAYMRSARLPSSYLRRVVSSRMLVKAALAEAIDEIDAAVGNYPHPGVWINNSGLNAGGNDNFGLTRNSESTRNGRNSNAWLGRVYIGGTSQVSRVQDRLVDQNKTVPTLSLEALAYIPPPLVNEARYYSRHSNAATWHTMGFDAGRYAFCALDVSDYFDINAVTAGLPRNSSPGGRISLAYLFENNDHSSADSQGNAWDTFIDQYANDVPLISLADWNLAIGSRTYGTGIMSYFYNYASGKGDSFYNGAAEGIGRDVISRMSFVTDGWFPETNVVGVAGDLTTMQPFSALADEGRDARQASVREIISGSSSTRKLIEENMSLLDIVALYDYLDKNDIPASLALPTVERVPMLVALQPNFDLTFTPTVENNIGELSDADWQVVSKTERRRPVKYTYKMKITPGNCMAGGLWMFPFLRDKEATQGSFQAELAARVGFAVIGARSRVDNNNRQCGFTVKDDADFAADGTAEKGALKLVGNGPTLNFSEVVDEDSAFNDQAANFGSSASKLVNWANGDDGVLFKTGFWQTQKKNSEEDVTWVDVPEDQWPAKEDEFWVNENFYPMQADLVNHAYGSSAAFKQALINRQDTVEVVPYLTITSRVKKDSKTVDLVPASYIDDKIYNQIEQDGNIGNLNRGQNEYPIMLLTDANSSKLVFGANGFKGGNALSVKFRPSASSQSFYCPDPRWNFAPENFFASDQAINTIKSYYKDNKSMVGLGVDGRDRDMFMGVSNQGFLQSVSELSFLPRTSTDLGGGDPIFGDTSGLLNPKLGNVFPSGNNLSDLAHGNLMWRTWRLYNMPGSGYARDDLYDMGIYTTSKGFAVSPFSDATNVFMAAFANTPCSWWAAYEDNEDINPASMTAAKFNQSYAFNGVNSSAKFDWKDLTRVAGNIMYAMRNSGNNWQQAFDTMDWAGTSSDFCGINFEGDTDDLYEVDRKMLYGFWRDCFAVKQQLFLIFVRAEPTMMGGGAIHQTPPQLGARAVALVWRDPNRSGQTGPNGALPHRTRVLFYRQFD